MKFNAFRVAFCATFGYLLARILVGVGLIALIVGINYLLKVNGWQVANAVRTDGGQVQRPTSDRTECKR